MNGLCDLVGGSGRHSILRENLRAGFVKLTSYCQKLVTQVSGGAFG